MKIAVCTLAWGYAWEKYAKRFVDTFEQYWPSDIELHLVTDETRGHPRAKEISLSSLRGFKEFKERWSEDPTARGMRPPKGQKVDDKGYSYRFDAVKWMPQALAPEPVAQGLSDGDILVWFDADTFTHKNVRPGWIEELIGKHDVVAPLRPGTYTEIGFYAVRINQWTRPAFAEFANLYREDRVFGLDEWHSAYAWDYAFRYKAGLNVGTVVNPNAAEYGKVKHVWPLSRLAEFTEHLKGKRKFR
jgi:hypothetical protein